MTAPRPGAADTLDDVGWSFAATDDEAAGEALHEFLGSLPLRPELLGLGEPMHGAEEFLILRNQLLRLLVERFGYRSVALESEALRGTRVDAYVTAGAGTLDEAMADGFSHGFGDFAANRALVGWLRQHNRTRPPNDQVHFYGVDAPLEQTGAASPAESLLALFDYLARWLDRMPYDRDELEKRLGAASAWSNPATVLDASAGIGGGDDARHLRLAADDLAALLDAESPRLIAASTADRWWLAALHARTATGLLRYHAALADTVPPQQDRLRRLMGQRDAMMAADLRAVRAREIDRGPTLVFAHHQHLQRSRSHWQLGEWTLRWWSAGAVVGAQLGDRYAVLTADLGASPRHDLPAPGSETLQGALTTDPDRIRLVSARWLEAALRVREVTLTARPGTGPEHGYFPFDPAQLDGTDGLLLIPTLD